MRAPRKTLRVIAYRINDANNGGNYSVTTGVPTTGTIATAPLIITATTNTKTYDSTATAGATPTVSGLQDGDSVTGLGEAYAYARAGTGQPLNVNGGYTVNDGNGGNNYAVLLVASTTGVITKAALTITATTNTKTYDSMTTASATPAVSGLVGNDTVTGLSEAYSNGNAGSNMTLSVTGYMISDGDDGNNYAVTPKSNSTGVINKAPLTIIVRTDTKTYDGTRTAAATPLVMGLMGTDTVTGLTEIYDTANAGSDKTLNVRHSKQYRSQLTGLTTATTGITTP